MCSLGFCCFPVPQNPFPHILPEVNPQPLRVCILTYVLFWILLFSSSAESSSAKYAPKKAVLSRFLSATLQSYLPSGSFAGKSAYIRFNEPPGTRTPDNLIKSQVLYHLS
jgi:hypothetical protein